MSQDKAFQEAVNALSQGQRARARDLFTRLLKRDSSDPEYWLWMSAVVDTTAEQIYCLQNVLHLDPNNQAAKQGLVMLGVRQADETLPLAPVIKRKWAAVAPVKEERQPVLKRIVSSRLLQIVGILATLIIVVTLVYYGVTAPSVKNSPTSTFIVVAITAHPTQTPSFSATPIRTITPALSAATPLKAYLGATYTPVPAYVNTPHPILEAYSIAIRSYERGDFARMIPYLEQALREEPTSPDIIYLLGEGYRRTGDYERALEFFEEAMDMDAFFAPPYLGRALVYSEINPLRDISADLIRAVDLDPYYLDAYLALADYHLENNNLLDAEQVLDELKNILGHEDARYFLSKARLLLAQEDFKSAMDAAQTANQLDQTMLPTYLTLAEAYLATGSYTTTIETVKVFLRYEPGFPKAWFILAQAQYLSGENAAETLKSLDKAIELNPDSPEGYGYRGSILLEQGDNQAAINDLLKAVHLDGSSFRYNLDLGRALIATERYTDAYRQLNVAERLAEEDVEKAAVYYWRARTLEATMNLTQAKAEWKKLLALPASALPADWQKYAQAHLLVLETPTLTVTSTPSVTKKITLTPTLTKTP